MAIPDNVKAFLEKFAPLAQAEEWKSGVPASVLLAQAGLETGWNASPVGNNLFGIKAGSSWTGEVVYVPTKEEINGQMVTQLAAFRKYDSVEDSISDRSAFLKGNDRYKAAIAERNPYMVANELQRAGYATDSSYASKLKNIMSSYGLLGYDKSGGIDQLNSGKPFEDVPLAMSPNDIKITPPKLNGVYENPSVIESVFGHSSDSDRQQAYERFNKLNPPAEIPSFGGFWKGIVGGGLTVVVMIVLLVLLAVMVINVIPKPAGIVKEVLT